MRSILALTFAFAFASSAIGCVPAQTQTPIAWSPTAQWPGPSQPLPPNGLVARAYAGGEPMSTPRGLAVVAFVSAQVGKPYCWGGTGPNCFDCSGLAQTAWRLVGTMIPRTTDAIARELPEVPLEAVRAGDVLWWPGHVGIYAGNGWVIDALDHKHGVVRRAATNPHRAFRPYDPAQPIASTR